MSQFGPPQMSLHAVKVTVWVPTSRGVGHQVNVPDVFVAFLENVAKGITGEGEKQLIGSPSGSTAVTTNVRHCPAMMDADEGAVTTGPRADNVMLMFVTAEP